MADSSSRASGGQTTGEALARWACPNPECAAFNHFGAGNLRRLEGIGRGQAIGRLSCTLCGHRFSERQGTLLEYSKLPVAVVVRVLKCLVHGCSIEAAADICEVRPQTVERLLEEAGRRAEDFHRLHLERLPRPPEVVEFDELHARVATAKKRGAGAAGSGRAAAKAATGSTWRCR